MSQLRPEVLGATVFAGSAPVTASFVRTNSVAELWRMASLRAAYKALK